MCTLQRLDCFPVEDGHIESILIGVEVVKVSFQTWDARQLVLIYRDVESVSESHAVYNDISKYTVTQLKDGLNRFCFFDGWHDDRLVLSIEAKTIEIVETGQNGGINSALFDVGYDYIGNQDVGVE